MELLILIGFCIALVIAFLVGYKYFKTSACYVLGIGGVVSANIYTTNNFGIQIFGITFGIDSIIYTVAIFCVVIMLINFGKKEAMTLTYTYMASILLTAITDFTIKWAVAGISTELVQGLVAYLASIVGTYLAIQVALIVYKYTERKLPTALDICLFVIIASIVNTLIYFGIQSIFFGGLDVLLMSLAGSYIGKAFTLIIFVCFYMLFRNGIIKNNKIKNEYGEYCYIREKKDKNEK